MPRTPPAFPIGNAAHNLRGEAKKLYVQGDPSKGEQRWKRLHQLAHVLRDARSLGWVTDVSSWSELMDYMVDKFIDEKYTDHRARKRGFAMTIVNNAYTVLSNGKHGKRFYYFDAVDRGRAAMTFSGRPLVFLSRFPPRTPESQQKNTKLKRGKGYSAPFLIYAKKIKASRPAYISARAKALVKNQFLNDIGEDIRKFIRRKGEAFAKQFGETQESLPDLKFLGFEREKTDRPKRSRAAEKARKIERNSPGFLEKEADRRAAEKKAKAKERADRRKGIKRQTPVSRPESTQVVRLVKKDGTFNNQEVKFKKPIRQVNEGTITSRQAEEEGLNPTSTKPALKNKVFELVPKIPIYFSDFEAVSLDPERLLEEVTNNEVNTYVDTEILKTKVSGENHVKTMNTKVKEEMLKIIVDNKLKEYEERRKIIIDKFKSDEDRIKKALGTPVYYGYAKQGGFIVEAKYEPFTGTNKKERAEYNEANRKLKETFNDAKRNVWLQMLKLQNPDALMHLFIHAVSKQLKHYKKVTPSRKGFKFLAFSNTYLEPNFPSKGSHPDILKNSYKLVTNKQASDRLRRIRPHL